MERSLRDKIADAHWKSSKWLADGREFEDRGLKDKAEKCYEKSQYWLDRLNKLEGRN